MIFLGVLGRVRKFSFGPSFCSQQFRCGIGRRFFAKMFLHSEMDSHNDGNDG